jgi:hypothetical protein
MNNDCNLKWNHDCQIAFNTLNKALKSPDVMALQSSSDTFTLDIDASEFGISV